MAYVVPAIIILAVAIILYRIIKHKKVPSNHYTPYDNMTMGTKNDVKRESPIVDTKHDIEYEEIIESK